MQIYEPNRVISAAPVLVSRGQDTPRDEVVSSRRDFGNLDGYMISGRRFQGVSPWERHPHQDELLYVEDGEAELTVLLDEGAQTITVRNGNLLVVPKGIWHKFDAKTTLSMWGATNVSSDEISFAEDPRA